MRSEGEATFKLLPYYEPSAEILRDSLKVTKLDHGPAETRTWTLQLLAQSWVTKATRRCGRPDTRELTPRPGLGSARPASGNLCSARGRARRPRSSPPRASPLSMVARARRERRRAPERGRGRVGAGPRGGRERPGRPAGDGWGGQLPGAAREDVATAPQCPSAPETPPRLSPEPPASGVGGPDPAPPHRSQVRAGQAAAAGEEAAAALPSAGHQAWGWVPGVAGVGALLGLGSRQAVVWGYLLCGARPGTLLALHGKGEAPASQEVSTFKVARTCPIRSPFKDGISPVGAVAGAV